jgi:type I restriction enzyme R subunit
VAFSGEVNDPEISSDGFTERSQTLNPGLKGEIREAFKGNDYQILLVANMSRPALISPCSAACMWTVASMAFRRCRPFLA